MIADCGLWNVDCGMWIVECGLWNMDCGFGFTDLQNETAGCIFASFLKRHKRIGFGV